MTIVTKKIDINLVDKHVYDYNLNIKNDGVQQQPEPDENGDEAFSPPDLAPPEVRLVTSVPPQAVDMFFKTDIDKSLTVAIVGESGSGKTGMAYEMFDQYQGNKQIYIFNHPNPQLIKTLKTRHGRQFWNIDDFNKVIWMRNIILWIDEPQIYFPRIEALVKFLSIARHKDITVVFTSNESRWFQARIEAYIQTWIIKDLDPDMVKRGGKVSKIIKRFQTFDNDTDKFRLKKDEFIFSSRAFAEYNGFYKNTIPVWFTDALSKPFSKTNPSYTVPEVAEEAYIVWDQ